MKQLIVLCLLWAVVACNEGAQDQHTHNPDGSNPGEPSQRTLSFTKYSEKFELFVEFKPLVVGRTSNFAAHLTKLGETFTPYREGTVTVSLIQGDKGIKNSVAAPGSPGIFRLAVQPARAGMGKLVFDIQTTAFSDQIIIDSVMVYEDEKSAIAAQPDEIESGDISYLKEQAWKVEFANTPVTKETVYDIVKATGQILSAPGDEITLSARSNGIIKFSGAKTVAGSAVRSGENLLTISGGQIPFENIEAARQTTKAELAAAKAEYERVTELIRDKLITQADFQAAKLRYEQAQIALNNLNRNYSAEGKSVSSPINGFIKNMMVSEGQYVTTGQPLATISKNQRLILKVDVSLKDASRISNVHEANFTVMQNKVTYNTKTLNAKLLSVGKATGEASPFIPVHFQLDGKPEMLPGSFAEVFLKTNPSSDALVIPVSALVEEQGIFYVYVQTEGESFQKRELKLGANDGQKVQVLSGIAEGERVVTKGAYQIKLAQASNTLPAHGHEH